MRDALRDLRIDHIRFYVHDAAAYAANLAAGYGFTPLASDPSGHTLAVGQGGTVLVLTEAAAGDAADRYVQAHDDGVADIALRTADVPAAYAAAVAGGATPVAEPAVRHGALTATIAAFGDVVHTLVQRSEAGYPPGLAPTGAPRVVPVGLERTDHIAVCVPAGELVTTVAYYERALGFSRIYTERIEIGTQAMNSAVVQSVSGDVTFTMLEPDTSRDPGQIDQFLKDHDGPGVQHIALSTNDIVRSVADMRDRGVTFLDTPNPYYAAMPRRLPSLDHAVSALRELKILADADHHGRLYQIFTRSTHPRRTLFFEVIQRCGARTFGSGNIRALYEAVNRSSGGG